MRDRIQKLFDIADSKERDGTARTAILPSRPSVPASSVAVAPPKSETYSDVPPNFRELYAAFVEKTMPLTSQPVGPGPRAKLDTDRPERRHRRRVKISAPVRIRQLDISQTTEYDFTMTVDVSREGLLFETTNATYARGQDVRVVFPYRPQPGEAVSEQRGRVVRVARASEKRYSIAVAFLDGAEETPNKNEVVDSGGRPINGSGPDRLARVLHSHKQLVVVVDADARTRASLRLQLENQGYAVEDMANPNDAVMTLRHRKPLALVCEAEPFPGALPGGAEMSGYDLCVIVRRNSKYAHIPVVVTSRTGLPTDFSTAHAMGATACIAKPFDLARVGNLISMLVPVEAEK